MNSLSLSLSLSLSIYIYIYIGMLDKIHACTTYSCTGLVDSWSCCQLSIDQSDAMVDSWSCQLTIHKSRCKNVVDDDDDTILLWNPTTFFMVKYWLSSLLFSCSGFITLVVVVDDWLIDWLIEWMNWHPNGKVSWEEDPTLCKRLSSAQLSSAQLGLKLWNILNHSLHQISCCINNSTSPTHHTFDAQLDKTSVVVVVHVVGGGGGVFQNHPSQKAMATPPAPPAPY